MTLVRFALAATLLVACSDDSGGRASADTTNATNVTGVPPGGDDGTSTMAASGDDPTTAASTPTTSTPGMTTGPEPGTTTTNDPSDPTSTTIPMGTSDDPISTDLPPPEPEGDYAAAYFPGEPNRLSVRKADKDNDLCTTLTFLGPAEEGPIEYDVTLPATWKVQGALVHQGATGCLSFEGFAGEPVMAYSGNGSATWVGAGCPATIDVDVLLAFSQDFPWVPVEVLLQSTAVPVQGC